MKKILIISDLHVPYHDDLAVRLMLKVGRAWKPDIIVSNGDFVDFYAVSAHRKDPTRLATLDAELHAGEIVLNRLDELGAREKYFLEGNHEDRLTRYLMDKAPGLYGLVGVRELLRLDQRKWRHVPYRDYLKLGKLIYTHDLDYSGKHVATRAVQDAQHSIIVGHAHRIGYAVEGDATGKPKLGACFGWLGDADKADYKHRLKAKRDWALGFGVGHMDGDGKTYVQAVPIFGDSCVVDGKKYTI